MGSQFYAINESGIKVASDSNESLGVIPMVTVSYLSFEDMSWNDIARVSRRVAGSSGCYIHRLNEKKSVELTDGRVIRVGLVGLTIDDESGFTFQITDGLDRSGFSNFMDEDLYELLPDDLKDVILPTTRGTAWIPSIENIVGPDVDEWYDWYQYHNTPKDRILTDSEGNPSGYWLNDTNDEGKFAVIDDRGNLSYVDSGRYVPSICFSVG